MHFHNIQRFGTACRPHGHAAKLCRNPQPIRSSCIAAAVPVSAEAHPTLKHAVAPGDTLWDVSVRYGVSMRSVRAVNGLPADFINIQPGELLALPAGAVEQTAGTVEQTAGTVEQEGAPADTVQQQTVQSVSANEEKEVSSTDHELWTSKGSFIKHTTPEEIEGILLAQGTAEAAKDTVIVTYTPGCKHCHSIEELMETVSSGLAQDPNLQMMALCCNTRSLKTWAKDSLAVRSFPSIMALPRHEPNVYRLTERGRTESGVVVFLNTVFQREGDAVLSLSSSTPVSAVTTSAAAAPTSTPATDVAAASSSRSMWPYFVGGALVLLSCAVFKNFRQYMVTPPGSSIDAADGTIPAEVAESAAGPPYKSARRGLREHTSSTTSVDESTVPVSAAAVADARGGSPPKPGGPAGDSAGGSGAGKEVVAGGRGDAVMESALAGRNEGGRALKAPKNPWAAPPEAQEGAVAAGGMLKVSTVAPVAAGVISAAIAEGVERDRGGKGIGEMARTRIGEAPPWEGLEKAKVLEAWHKCGGDVDELARTLKDGNGAMADVGL